MHAPNESRFWGNGVSRGAPKFKELRADTALAQEEKRKKMMEIRKAEMEEVRALLTPEQQEKMKGMRAAAKPAK